jgi:F-type H+-transporting ATPase subunit delta
LIKEEIVAKRYANAFLAYAQETVGTAKGLDELQEAKRIVRDNTDLRDFLKSLEFANTEKEEVIDAVFKDEFSDVTRNFLKLLIEKRRVGLFVDIAEYARITYAHGIEMDAVLKTSYPLDTEVIERLKSALEKKVNKKLHLYVELDPDLGGGVYAKIGNIIIDGSVKKRLEDLKEKLTALRVA